MTSILWANFVNQWVPIFTIIRYTLAFLSLEIHALVCNAGNSVVPWLDISAGLTIFRFKDTVAASRAGLVLAQKVTVHVLMVRPTYL
jgi:hypothetical protein